MKRRGQTGTPMRTIRRSSLRPVKLSDSELLAEAKHDLQQEVPTRREWPAYFDQEQPCPGCQGVVRKGDLYVNRKTAPRFLWEPWHVFCWDER